MADREKFVEQAKSWIGAKYPDARYLEIIKIFESNKKHLKYDGQGCCEFTVACALKCFGLDQKYIPVMNYANGQAKLWTELKSVPSVGSLMYFDYHDGMGISHVEIVTEILESKIRTVDGNSNHKVVQRTRDKKNQDIAGYGTPVWKEEIIKMDDFTNAMISQFPLRLHCRGPMVLWMQKYLQANGFYKDGFLDSYFESYMHKEVKAWQKSVGLLADGVIGENSYRYILKHAK